MISVMGMMFLAKLSGEYRPPSTEILKLIILAQFIGKIPNRTSNNCVWRRGSILLPIPIHTEVVAL